MPEGVLRSRDRRRVDGPGGETRLGLGQLDHGLEARQRVAPRAPGGERLGLLLIGAGSCFVEQAVRGSPRAPHDLARLVRVKAAAVPDVPAAQRRHEAHLAPMLSREAETVREVRVGIRLGRWRVQPGATPAGLLEVPERRPALLRAGVVVATGGDAPLAS